MKIAVFGGTGKAGRLFIQQALAAGHSVTALARSPEKIGANVPGLTIVPGDATDPAAVNQAIAGADAVVSLLGPVKGQAPGTVTRAVENILAAMQNHSVRRLVISAGAGVGDPQDRPGLPDRLIGFLLKVSARSVYEDMLQVARLVRGSDLDWTLVRAPMLTDDPKTGRVSAAYLGQGAGMRLSRADMAAYMLGQLESSEQLRKAPVISTAK